MLAVALSSLFTISSSAWAFEETAKSEGLHRYRAGKDYYTQRLYLKAADEFYLGLEVLPLPEMALWAARSDAFAGNLVSAAETYRHAILLTQNELWLGDKQQLAQEEARSELAQLRKRLVALRLKLPSSTGTDAKLSLDGASLAPVLWQREFYVLPGSHVVALADASGTIERSLIVVEGEERVISLELSETDPAPTATPLPATPRTPPGRPTPTAAPPRPPPILTSSSPATPPTNPWRTAGWIGLSVGGAALVTGTVTGLVLAARHDDLALDCPTGTCDPNAVSGSQVTQYNTLRVVTTASLVTGTVLAGVGLTLIVSNPTAKPPEKLGIGLSPLGAHLNGTF